MGIKKWPVNWEVDFTRDALKQTKKLPLNVVAELRILVTEIKDSGPLRHNWKNFSKFKGSENKYHCHIKAGRPTYVVCWEVTSKKIKIVEIYYVGTHEKAPY